MKFGLDEPELLFVASFVTGDKTINEGGQLGLMSKFPEIPPSKKTVDNGSNEISIGIVSLLKGLAEVVEHVNMVLKSIESFLRSSGVE